jgi:serine/threonine-protein kinase
MASMNGVREPGTARPRVIGRYAMFDEVGRGGAASVHIGRLLGPIGFSRTVAIKKMHESVAGDEEVVAMFLDEARLTGRIRHPNVVPVLDVLAMESEVFLIMEYVHGESLSSLLRVLQTRNEPVPVHIAVHIMRDVLHGLHAAHEARGDGGQPLDLVHRDVSPQNIQVGADGISRILDFGIAKAVDRIQDTHTGQLKGKVSYMAPEQLMGQAIDRRVDVYAAGLVLWEALAGRRLFFGDSSGNVMYRVLKGEIPELPDVPPRVREAVSRAIERDPASRFGTALEFALALEEALDPVAPTVIGDWVREVSGPSLAKRYELLEAMEATPVVSTRTLPETPPRESGLRATRWVIPAVAAVVALGVTSAFALRYTAASRAVQVETPTSTLPPPMDVTAATEGSPATGQAASSTGARSTPPASRTDARNPSPASSNGPGGAGSKKAIPKGGTGRQPLRRPEDLFSRE